MAVMAVRMLWEGDDTLAREVLARFKGRGDPAEFLGDPRVLLFVAEERDGIVGWAYGYELIRPEGRRAMLLYEVEVATDARGRGHGRALVEAMLAEARRRGHFEMWVLAEPGDDPAEALYRSTGGDCVGQTMWTWELRPE